MKNYIENYLISHGWKKEINNNKEMFTQNNNLEYETKSKKHKYFDLQRALNSIKSFFQNMNYKDIHFDTVVNPYKDTDYIIAALQTINKIKHYEIKYSKLKWYSLQPCIRSVPEDKKISEGFLPSFVNIGTIGISQNRDDYVNMLEDWISVLSKCSIHVSRIKLIVKEKTNAYSGAGLSIYVDDVEIGQANYYKSKSVFDLDEDTYVLDFGFGLERLVWASNCFDDFGCIYQSKEDYFLYNDNISALTNKLVLLIMSGVCPNSSKFGLKLREDFEAIINICNNKNICNSIKFAFNYWKQFISSKLSLEDVYNIWDDEIDYLFNINLSNHLDIKPNVKRLKENSCLFCSNIFKDGARRK